MKIYYVYKETFLFRFYNFVFLSKKTRFYNEDHDNEHHKNERLMS